MKKFGVITYLLLCFAAFGKGVEAFPVFEIRAEGVPNEMIETVKTLSAVLPGDEYETAKAERGEEKIQEYLEGKGYPQAQVSSDILNQDGHRILQYSVVLGPSIKLAQVAFQAKGEVISPVLLTRLNLAVDLKPGELFDRDRIKEMRRAIEQVLFSQNFIDSKIEDITTEVTIAGLKLNFLLELGQNVILSVSGNQYYSRSELMTFIQEQRALGLGRDYINVLLGRLKDLYLEHGFRAVKITPYSFEAHGHEPKKVVFDVSEGRRTRIHKLVFDGNDVFKDNELRDLFYKNATDRIVAKIYNEKMIEDASKNMIDELKKRGYLAAKLIAIKTEEISPLQVDLRIFINEGLQTRIQAIDFRGNHVIDVERLGALLGLKEGDPLNLVQLEDGLDQIKKEYRNQGYLNFKINNENTRQIVTYSEKNQYAYLNFDIEEGPILTLDHFDIFGNENTKRVVIERELRIKVGEPLGEAKVLETEQRLRRLGIFSQVNLEFKESATTPNAKDMRVSVQEAVPGSSALGIGFRNDLGVRVFGEVAYANLWGMNHTWALDVSANRRLVDYHFNEYAAQVSYTWPWAIFGETTFRPSLSAEKRQYHIFDAETVAFSLGLDRLLYNPIKLSGGLTYTLEHVRQFNALDDIDNAQVQIGSITPSLRVDLRDNPLSPRHGFFAITSFEYASSALGSQSKPVPVSYGRYQLRSDYYADFIPRVNWFSSFRGGWLKNLISPTLPDGSNDPRVSVPLIKQFALGGINSIRGFSDQEMNVQSVHSNQRVQGFLTYVNYRTQMDFLLTPNLSFGPFLDAGNLQLDTFSLGNLRFGSGVGMRYITPVGPVNFDWGFKIDPRPGEDRNAFYFSLGVI